MMRINRTELAIDALALASSVIFWMLIRHIKRDH